MREHEYRAWDKKLNIMWEAIELKKLLRYLVFESMPNATAYKEIKDHFDDIVWLQYLNRKDKNGKKLFEGDEVAAHHPDHTKIFIGDVVFDVELLTYYFDGPRFYIPISEFEDFEIIGNIYEPSPNRHQEKRCLVTI